MKKIFNLMMVFILVTIVAEGAFKIPNISDLADIASDTISVASDTKDYVVYGNDGFDKNGFDKEGYDINGYNESGYNKYGFNSEGYDASGYDKNKLGKDGYSVDGYDAKGYKRNGYNDNGYDKNGKDRDGYNWRGYDKYGYNKLGLNDKGFNKDGFDKEGYNSKGFDKNNKHKSGKSLTKVQYTFIGRPDIFELLLASNMMSEADAVRYEFTNLTVNDKHIPDSNKNFKYTYKMGTKAIVKYTVSVYKKDNTNKVYLYDQYTTSTTIQYKDINDYISKTGDKSLNGKFNWILDI